MIVEFIFYNKHIWILNTDIIFINLIKIFLSNKGVTISINNNLYLVLKIHFYWYVPNLIKNTR